MNGIAGERFCVRNSGAIAVCEGVGDHGCEYMTGGRVVILGRTGKNFAAGMSGGVAYVLDEAHDLYTRLNKALVSLEGVTKQWDIAELRELIEAHVEATGSPKAKRILDNFAQYLPQFKKIIPHDYAKITAAVAELTAQGASAGEAEIEAFNQLRKEA
jgi:glutamate synthase (ferredoxin)